MLHTHDLKFWWVKLELHAQGEQGTRRPQMWKTAPQEALQVLASPGGPPK